MKKKFSPWLLWPMMILVFALFASIARGQDISIRPAGIPKTATLAYVVGVRDGDNLTVRDSVSSVTDTLGYKHLRLGPSYEVRIFAIDAPGVYMGPRFPPGQTYGPEARAMMKDTLHSHFVYVDTISHSFNRKVARVWFVDGRDVAAYSLENGLSWFSGQEGILTEYQAGLKDIWRKSKSKRIGLFANKKAIHPVTFKNNWRRSLKTDFTE